MTLVVQNLPANAGDVRDANQIPGSGRSAGGGHGNPLQYCCLENPHGQRSLVGYSPQGRKESDMTEVTKYACIGLHWWLSGKESTCQCRRPRRCELDPWVRKIRWRRKWQPTPVFLPGESHGQRSQEGYSPWGHKGSDMTEAT